MIDVTGIPVKLTPYTVVEKREVETYVKLFLFLPLEIEVGVVGGTIRRKPLAGCLVEPSAGVVGQTLYGHTCAEVVVTGHTVSDAELEIAQPVTGIFHEFLTADAPTA